MNEIFLNSEAFQYIAIIDVVICIWACYRLIKSIKDEFNKTATYIINLNLFLFSLLLFSSLIETESSNSSSPNNNSTIESIPNGVSAACFCADYLNGGGLYDHTPLQKDSCRRMYKCMENALIDCVNGTESIWTSCVPLYD